MIQKKPKEEAKDIFLEFLNLLPISQDVNEPLRSTQNYNQVETAKKMAHYHVISISHILMDVSHDTTASGLFDYYTEVKKEIEKLKL